MFLSIIMNARNVDLQLNVIISFQLLPIAILFSEKNQFYSKLNVMGSSLKPNLVCLNKNEEEHTHSINI
jgi:hypothetical protein